MQFSRYDRVQREEYNHAVSHGLSEENQLKVQAIQDQLAELGLDDHFWFPSAASLHTTLFDWTPAIADEVLNDHTYQSIQDDYISAMEKAAESTKPFDVHFDTLRVFGDTIILEASENPAEMSAMRTEFQNSVQWVDGNKRPPELTHCTIGRCETPVLVPGFEEAVDKIQVDITQRFDEFRLCRATSNSMGSFSVVRTFPL